MDLIASLVFALLEHLPVRTGAALLPLLTLGTVRPRGDRSGPFSALRIERRGGILLVGDTYCLLLSILAWVVVALLTSRLLRL